MQKTENLEKEILEIKVLPKLRFREFNDSWNEMKLNDFTKIQRGKFTPRPRNNPIYYGGNIPFVQTSDVVKSKGKIFKYSQTLNEKGLKVSKKFKKGTILITVAANIGFSGVLEIDVACPDSLIGITCNEHNYNFFLQYLIEIEQPKMDYLAVAAAQKNINLEFLYPYKFILPTLKEQKKIASFLSVVDEKLQQLTKKKELLEGYKKGIMQKIFSQEIRFKDDNGSVFRNWEEKKLGHICSIIKGKQLNKSELTESGLFPALNGGVNPSGYTDKWNTEKNVITISEGGNSCGYVNLSKTKFWCGGHCYSLIGINDNTDFKYLFQILKFLQIKIMKLRVGSGLPNIQMKEINKFSVIIPDLKEQVKIANFLSSIDNKIESVSAQIEKTKEFKKGLLQQMFV